ncbi:hypothetical protein Bca101_088892 [Brassica carinata]
MSQSQLIGSSGEMKNGEGVRKRLKISVPHFNNSDLIKGYSKTLIGRCMNPEEQNVKFLVVTLPKIWNFEEKVVGTDLGLGRFQFDFDDEEDIETVLKMQPFHFDYWMISLKCPLTSNNPDKMVEIRDEPEGGFEDRARSYKGVVINGNGGQQDRGREKREYQGKGKGKMYEETDSKWVRAADREYKFYSNKNQRSGHRGEEENSRHRNSRREQIRSHHQDERARIPTGLRGESIARSEARSKGRTEGKEEGEIKEKELERSKHKETKVQDQAQPSQAFLAELMETQGELSKVISNPSGGEREVDLENMDLGLVEGNNFDSDVGMGLEEHHYDNVSIGNHESLGTESHVIDEEEMEEEVQMQEVMTENPEEKKKIEDMEGKDGITGEVEKRQGTRKKAVKASMGAAASNKLKMAQLVAAKRSVAKQSIHHGDHSKQGEENGTSGPKHEPAKQAKEP